MLVHNYEVLKEIKQFTQESLEKAKVAVRYVTDKLYGIKRVGTVAGNVVYDPTNGGVRGDDGPGLGCGGFTCTRGSRIHQSLDMISDPGQDVKAPIDGTIESVGPQNDGIHNYNRITVISNDKKVKIDILYSDRVSGITTGSPVIGGQTVIGVAKDIRIAPYTYGPRITNHNHMKVMERQSNGTYKPVDPREN